MRHVSDAVLRRLLDEPFAVPDAARLHVETCGRCRACRGQISGDAAFARRVLSPPQLAFDSGLAWTQVEHRLAGPAGSGHPAFRVPRRPARRLVNASIGTGTAAAAGLVLAGVAAAATLTTVFAPTKVAPVQVNPGDLRAIATALGIGPVHPHGGLSPAAGSEQLPFGTLRWTSAGQAQRVASLHQARALTSLTYSPPATLPAGVGSPSAIIVQPKETATISFSPAAGRPVGGSSLMVTGGPAVLVQYGSSSSGASLTTLGVLTMQRPVASSTGTTTSQLESFLLSRPGIPASLAQEIRLLGNLSAVLPVPTPAGAATGHVRIGGSPGILIADASGAASGVIWETRSGIVHVVAGLLDRKDILNVARQLG